MPEYPRSPFKKTGTSITPNVDGDVINSTVIGETTPAAGSFTTLNVSDQIQGDIVNNLNAFDFGERIMELATDLIFLNVLCDDPSGGTNSYVDISTKGNHGTPFGSWTSGDRLKQGRAWVLDPDGDNDYISLGQSDDFSFGDGSNDSPFTMFGMIEIGDGITNRCIFSKWDETTASKAREYLVFIGSTEKLNVFIKDESAGVECIRTTNDSLSIGNHSFVVTYDGVGGGTAANGIIIYIDGVVVASTATNNASYVAMEKLTVPLWIGSWMNSAGQANSFMENDFGCLGIDDAEWSAMTAWRFHQLCLVNYSEDGVGL